VIETVLNRTFGGNEGDAIEFFLEVHRQWAVGSVPPGSIAVREPEGLFGLRRQSVATTTLWLSFGAPNNPKRCRAALATALKVKPRSNQFNRNAVASIPKTYRRDLRTQPRWGWVCSSYMYPG
jgi:hypothetical protein